MKSSEKDLPDEPFDPDDDRLIEEDELFFSDDEEPNFNQLSPEDDSNAMELVSDDNDPQANDDMDNLDPEILIKEDGARSPHEISPDIPADEELTIVNADDIGAGYGLDEAELADLQPLDGGKPDV